MKKKEILLKSILKDYQRKGLEVGSFSYYPAFEGLDCKIIQQIFINPQIRQECITLISYIPKLYKAFLNKKDIDIENLEYLTQNDYLKIFTNLESSRKILGLPFLLLEEDLFGKFLKGHNSFKLSSKQYELDVYDEDKAFLNGYKYDKTPLVKYIDFYN